MPAQPRHTARRHRAAAGAAVAVVLAASLGGCAGTHPTARATRSSSEPPLGYRSLPAFLPTTGAPVDQVVTASPAHPQLAVQGLGVQVDLYGGSVLATVTGPQVPPFVAPPPPQVTATFKVSLARATGTVPIRLSDFTITDQLGRTFHPTLANGQEPLPATVPAGQTVNFQLTAAMPTGEGRLHWSPFGASTPLVSWDFIVEND